MARATTAVMLTVIVVIVLLGTAGRTTAAYLDGTGTYRINPPPRPAPVATEETPDGFIAASSQGPIVGAGGGRLVTYRVEVEPGLDLQELVRQVDAILGDPRSWTADGDVRLQRVAHDPDLRVVLASPAIVDERCARAGLRTNGWFSCFDGSAAMLNLDRWTQGTWRFPGDLHTYRTYLVNHEVGHGLGHGHVGCPARGAPAPVMMQQTKGLDGCAVNPWPHPDEL